VEDHVGGSHRHGVDYLPGIEQIPRNWLQLGMRRETLMAGSFMHQRPNPVPPGKQYIYEMGTREPSRSGNKYAHKDTAKKIPAAPHRAAGSPTSVQL
jgi:hypothetical protein